MSGFCERLKELRKENAWSQAELGEHLSNISGSEKPVPASTISGYENGYRQPDFRAMQSFAKLFGVSIDYLTGFSDERYSSVHITGDYSTDNLAVCFAKMVEKRLSKARELDNAISEHLSQCDSNVEWFTYKPYDKTNSCIYNYLLYCIDVIGNNIDYSLDNSKLWLETDNDGGFRFNRHLMARLLDRNYFDIINTDNEKV